MNNMEEKYLYPAFPVMCIGVGDGFIDYPLSRVLGSWGYVIRDIISRRSYIEVICDLGAGGEKVARHSFSFSLSPECSGAFMHPFDAVIRYRVSGDDLAEPVCVSVISATDLISK